MSSEETGLKLVDFLDHIAEASRLARDYVAGMSKESFLKDRRTQQAVVLNLMVIGEAAARIVNEQGSSWHDLVAAATFSNMRRRAHELAPNAGGILASTAVFFRHGASGDGVSVLSESERDQSHARERGLPGLASSLSRLRPPFAPRGDRQD